MDASAEQATAAGLEAFVRDLYDAVDRRDSDRFRSMLVNDYQQVDERLGVWFRGLPDEIVKGNRAEIDAAESHAQRHR